MRNRRLLGFASILTLFATCGAAAAAADTEACALSAPERHRVVEVKERRDAVPHRWDDCAVDRRQGAVRTGVRARAVDAALAAARETVRCRGLAEGAEIELRYGGTRTDRHGRALAQVFVVKGGERLWVQGEIVGGVLPASIPFPTTTLASYDLGARGRGAGKGPGLWGPGPMHARRRRMWSGWADDPQLPARRGRGRRGWQGGRLYLNFDKDWRRDFTIPVERKDGEDFKAEGSIPRPLPESASGPGLGRVAQRPDDPRDPCRANRAPARAVTDQRRREEQPPSSSTEL